MNFFPGHSEHQLDSHLEFQRFHSVLFLREGAYPEDL